MDAFSKCHPAVNFLFFVGTIGLLVVIQHPAFLLAGVLTGAVYYLLLNGKKGWKTILGLLPMFCIVTAINPLLNTLGQTPLFLCLEDLTPWRHCTTVGQWAVFLWR